MNIERWREIDGLLTPEEALEFALVKNDEDTIFEALKEHKLRTSELEDSEPEDALDYAIEHLPQNVLTLILKEHGYQPIPAAKKAKRAKALSH